MGNQHVGTLEASLASALAEVMGVPKGQVKKIVTVSVVDRIAYVDFSTGILGYNKSLLEDNRGLLGSAFLDTAYSDSRIDGVAFSVAGDCMTYAVMTGGDACAVVRFSEIPLS